MSEPMFPGGGGAAAPAPAEPVEQKSNRRTLLALGVSSRRWSSSAVPSS